MSIIDPVRRPDLDALIRTLIEEARQRARRRRRVYGGVVFSIAVFGAILLAPLRGASSSESGSPAVLAGPGTPLAPVATGQHTYYGAFFCDGERGSFSVKVAFRDSGERSWTIERSQTGQYALLRGRGRHIEAGGHASAWYARLVGFVTPEGGPRQRVVIKLKGRPEGTFVLIPTQPGVLKRDSGTQRSAWLG